MAALIGVAYETLRSQLKEVGDMERVVSRVALGSASPRDLGRLRTALDALPELVNGLPSHDPATERLAGALPPFQATRERLASALVESPPATIREGGAIRAGFDAGLDELKNLTENSAAWLAELEQTERQRTGISTLKVGYNRVHGYYIETTRGADEAMIPPEYVRRQTLKNAERYITPELKAFEDKALTAQSKALALEKALFQDLLAELSKRAGRASAGRERRRRAGRADHLCRTGHQPGSVRTGTQRRAGHRNPAPAGILWSKRCRTRPSYRTT